MIKNIKPRVEKLLIEYPYLRDSYNATLAMIWEEDIRKLHFSPYILIQNLIDQIVDGKLTSPESVRRSWQIIQQNRPELRGKNYNFRHKVKEPEVRQEIKEINEHEQES